MNPELINTAIMFGVPTVATLGSYASTRRIIAHNSRRLLLEYRFDELIRQGVVETFLVPIVILGVSTLSAFAIGENHPLDLESFSQLVDAMSALGIIFGTTIGCMVGGKTKINLGQQLRVLYPDAKPRTVIDGIARDINDTSHLST